MKKINIILIIVILLLITSTVIFFNRKESVVTPEPVKTEKFSTSTYKYTNFFDWPPQPETSDKEYSCIQTSTTTEIVINNYTYCKSVISEGAAGSLYNTYTYSFAKENNTVSITFSTRQPQCMNYDNPKQTECLNEIKSVDVDKIVDEYTFNLRK